MHSPSFKLILASQSPRRKELLGHLKIAIDVVPADIDEDIACTSPRKLVEELSHLKADATWLKIMSQNPSPPFRPLVLAADTTVALGDKIFNKPRDVEDARQMLCQLSGKTHDVFTAFTIMGQWPSSRGDVVQSITRSCQSQVTFEEIDEDILELYLRSGESLDKAGAYGIQGQGLMFISIVQGAYSNVVGLPLFAVIQELKKIAGGKSDWRQYFGPQ